MEIPIFTRLSHLVTFFFVIIAIIVAGCENNNGGGASGAFGAGILNGWYENGYPQEKIYDLALSDGRIADPKTGKVPPVGNTVDVKNASYTND
ncbi:MAG: DUF3604 domain-containing protein, partial [Candidatus Dadabacteria bacterium]|nr:DUF3604 domain-containing protein [Candidatus Dadabacteria bacterium]